MAHGAQSTVCEFQPMANEKLTSNKKEIETLSEECTRVIAKEQEMRELVHKNSRRLDSLRADVKKVEKWVKAASAPPPLANIGGRHEDSGDEDITDDNLAYGKSAAKTTNPRTAESHLENHLEGHHQK